MRDRSSTSSFLASRVVASWRRSWNVRPTISAQELADADLVDLGRLDPRIGHTLNGGLSVGFDACVWPRDRIGRWLRLLRNRRGAVGPEIRLTRIKRGPDDPWLPNDYAAAVAEWNRRPA